MIALNKLSIIFEAKYFAYYYFIKNITNSIMKILVHKNWYKLLNKIKIQGKNMRI